MTAKPRPIDERIYRLSAAHLPDNLSDLVRERGLVLITGVDFQREDFSKLLYSLGKVVRHPFLPQSEGSDYSVLERKDDHVGGFIYGGAWHQNLAFLEAPPDITVLYAEVLQDASNYTAFIDLAEVDPWYSEGVRGLLGSNKAVHSTTAPLSPQRALKLDASAQQEVSTTHPCYVIDRVTGTRWPYVMSNYITNLVGWRPEEAMPLVQALYKFAQHDEFVIRNYWQVNDLLLWDNRRYMHRATITHHRGHRVMIRGDVTCGWGLGESVTV